MMRFHPAPGAMPRVPNSTKVVGQAARYIGHKLNPTSKEYEPTGKPYECEPNSAEFDRCLKMVRRGDVLPADEATAKACGIAFSASPAASSDAKKGAK